MPQYRTTRSICVDCIRYDWCDVNSYSCLTDPERCNLRLMSEGGVMSEVEGVRKLLQDLVTPDLKGLQVQVASLEKSLQTSIATLEKSSQVAMASLERTVDFRFDAAKQLTTQQLDSIRDITAQQLKTQQVELNASLEQNLNKILSAIERLDTRLSYFESRFGSERNSPIYTQESSWFPRVVPSEASFQGPGPRPGTTTGTQSDIAQSLNELLRRLPPAAAGE